MFTWNTVVGCLQVGCKVSWTWLFAMQAVHIEGTLMPSRALPIHLRENIGSTTDVPVILFNTLSQPHTSILGTSDEEYILWATTRTELSRLAILVTFWNGTDIVQLHANLRGPKWRFRKWYRRGLLLDYYHRNLFLKDLRWKLAWDTFVTTSICLNVGT